MNSLEISPVSDRFPIAPSQHLERTFNVKNNSEGEISFRLYSEQFSSDEFSQITRWISFPDAEITLKAGEEKEVTYFINTPDNIPDGGQYCNLIVELERNSTGRIQVASRAALKVHAINRGSTKELAKVDNVDVRMLNVGSAAGASATVTNNGNVDFQAEVKLTRSSIFGGEISSNSMLVSLYPGDSKQIYIQSSGSTSLGIYQMHYTLAAVDKTIDTTYLALVLPIHSLLMLFAVFLAILAIIVRAVSIHRIRKSREEK